ncbi:ROK family protein [Apibacter sp. HY039]|uniref:ROK family protein n=1 Tax=Apibacter sp. HY039 TaxID=2501476 RepID=UPI000FEBF6AE|nr:ROK family protein [Apibacter sp. HY039]
MNNFKKIGIDIGGTNIRVALVDDSGIIKILKEPCKADQPEDVIVDQVKNMIHEIITPDVVGIGIGVPSTVDVKLGIVYNLNNIPSWKEVHLKEKLEQEFSVPTYVNNDANCFALGHKHYGLAKEYSNIVCIAMGTGLGSGLIFNEELYIGANTAAGEIGCVPYLDSTYEGYCSSHFFKRFHSHTTSFDLFNQAKEGNTEALQIWEEFGKHVGALVSFVLFTYDPQAIVFGGSVSKSFEFFSPSMHKYLEGFLFPKNVEKLVIRLSEVKDISVLGAASLVKNEVSKLV